MTFVKQTLTSELVFSAEPCTYFAYSSSLHALLLNNLTLLLLFQLLLLPCSITWYHLYFRVLTLLLFLVWFPAVFFCTLILNIFYFFSWLTAKLYNFCENFFFCSPMWKVFSPVWLKHIMWTARVGDLEMGRNYHLPCSFYQCRFLFMAHVQNLIEVSVSWLQSEQIIRLNAR